MQKDLSSFKIDKIKYKLIQKEDNDNEGKGFKLQPQSFPIWYTTDLAQEMPNQVNYTCKNTWNVIVNTNMETN